LRFGLESGIIAPELLCGGKGFGYEEGVVDTSNPCRGESLFSQILWRYGQVEYSLTKSQRLKTGLSVCSADIWPSPGGDGRVDALDLAAMSKNWLKGF
jgi:hypothetical protein